MDDQKAAVKDRVRKSRQRLVEAGLKRVEVIVPEDRVNDVRAYAADLREGSESERRKEVRKLLKQAYRRFHARCLDNISVDPENASLSDAAVIASALMYRGDGKAYQLGREILKHISG